MVIRKFEKDPDAVLDYRIDWTEWLDGDTIDEDGSEWIYDEEGDLVVESDSHTTKTATVFVSGGVVGQSYTLTNRITTAGGRTDDRSIAILIANK